MERAGIIRPQRELDFRDRTDAGANSDPLWVGLQRPGFNVFLLSPVPGKSGNTIGSLPFDLEFLL